MTVKLTTCTRCGRDMHPFDMAPIYATDANEERGINPIIPKICSGCRIDLAEEAAAAKRAFYEEEKRV